MLNVTTHGSITELQLARPPVNALNVALVEALRGALAQAVTSGARGLVISGAPGRFSGGLDVPALLALDRAGVRGLWQAFLGLLDDIAGAPVPVVAAITGHSPAGGAVLALFADWRVMAEGSFVIGLNEVQVGLAVPPFLVRALGYVVGARRAAALASTGALLSPQEALQAGLVDEVVAPADVVPRACAWLQTLLRLPENAVRATREAARSELRATVHKLGADVIDDVVDRWFSDETQRTLHALAARLGKSSAT